ncbi:MAG: hypothetical protein IJA51_01425 [Oscillospiraceae bacterium]|nr:hypothetical protein [Oscillospiraceae bacterium]
MYKKCCGTCKYFRQHYVLWSNGRYVGIPHGHCVYPRLKDRRKETDGCAYWTLKVKQDSR